MKFFFIIESLREPLLNVANKLLGRQHLNFEQLTPPEQQLWNKLQKVTFMSSSPVQETQCQNFAITGLPFQPARK